MKKIFSILFAIVLLSGCSVNQKLNNKNDLNNNKIADDLEAYLSIDSDSTKDILIMYTDHRVELQKKASIDDINEKAKNQDVLMIEPNYEVSADLIYSTKQIGAYEVWTDLNMLYTGDTFASSDIAIAVLDTGVDEDHQDFSSLGKIVNQANCYSVTPCTGTQNDDNGHGTHVAGISLGTGTAWDSGTNVLSLEFKDNFVGTNYGVIKYFPIKVDTANAYTSQDLDIYLTWNDTSGSEAAIQIKKVEDLDNSNYIDNLIDVLANPGPGAGTGEFISKTSISLDPNGSIYPNFIALPYATSNTDTNTAPFWLRLDLKAEKWGTETSVTQGVAPGSKLVAVKVLNSSGSGNVSDIINGFEYLEDKLDTYNIVVANLSLSLNGGASSEILNAKITDLINKGLTVVASAGNSQGDNYVGSPGINPLAIAVGAVNSENKLTTYSSTGDPGSNDIKPDILAPGGSINNVGILSAKTLYGTLSYWNHLEDAGLNDSYTLKVGTSQAAPHVAGAVALVADALDTWSFSSAAYPKLAKMLLCMTATEIGASEDDAVSVGTQERSAVLKDRIEGYGLMDVYGAISAIDTWDYDATDEDFSFSNYAYGRRSYARKLSLDKEKEYNFVLSVPAGADYDLYLFDDTPDSNGEPQLLASSPLKVAEVEQIVDFIPESTGSYYLVAKRVSGSGAGTFALLSKRDKPASPTTISDLMIRQDINSKKIFVSWKTNVKAISQVQYGSTAGLGSVEENTIYKTDHSFDIYAQENPVYLRVLSSSTGDSAETISTAVSAVNKVEYTTIDHNPSASELSVNEDDTKVAGCGFIDNSSNTPPYFLMFLFPLLLLTFLKFRVSKLLNVK